MLQSHARVFLRSLDWAITLNGIDAIHRVRKHVGTPRASPAASHASANVLIYWLVYNCQRHVAPILACEDVVIKAHIVSVRESKPRASRLGQLLPAPCTHGRHGVGKYVGLRVERSQYDRNVIPPASSCVPLREAISAIQVGALDAMKERDALLTLSTHAHLNPRPSVVLTSASAVQPIEAALAQKVLALIAEEHRIFHYMVTAFILAVFKRAMNANLHLQYLSGLFIPGALELANDVAITLHQHPEVQIGRAHV